MTKIELYEAAVATGKSLVGEMDNIKLSLSTAQAAEAGGVVGSDFPQFQQIVNQTRQLYSSMARQKLASEIAALQAISKAPASNATAVAPAQ